MSELDPELFYSHIQHIYNVFGDSHSNPHSGFHSIDALVLVRGKYLEDNKDTTQKKTSLFHDYIFNYDLTDTLIFFAPKKIYFFVASKKKALLESMKKPSNINVPEIKIVLRTPSDDNTPKIKQIFEEIQKDVNKSNIKIGYLKEEKGIGRVVEEFYKVTDSEDWINLVDTPLIVDEIIQTKDKNEFNLINIASRFSCYILEHLNKEFEVDVDEEKTVTHKKISEDIKKMTDKDSFKKKFVDKNSKYKISSQFLEIKNSPVIQSGGNYTLDINVPSDTNVLCSDVIICKASSSYKDYNGQVVRTFMIDSRKSQHDQYKILLAAFDKLLKLLKEAANTEKTFGSIYQEIREYIISKDENLKNCIPECFGYGIGLESENENLKIEENSETCVKHGMVIFVHLSLINLEIENNKEKNFMMQIGDTICIDDKGELINFTEKFSKDLNDIDYNLESQGDDKESENKQNIEEVGSNMRVTRHMGKKVDEKFNEREKRKDHQELLLKQKNEDFKRRYEEGENFLKEEAAIKKKDYSNLKCFENVRQFPADLKNGKIYLDQKHYTIFLPIFKRMVPFHIGLIKNTSKSEDSNYTILRINFVIPVSGNELESIKDPNPVFIREVSYKFKDATFVQNLITKIKDLMKAYKAKEQEEREKEDIIEQDKIIVRKEKRIFLNELNVKQNLLSKKAQGTLEAHINGFRFISNKNEKIDIIYNNIAHAFLETCENDLLAFIHFNLKSPILIGKKKVNDVQFYRDIGSQADDINMKGRGYDYDEYEMELKEKKRIENMNKEFLRFSKNVEDICDIRFELPYRELEFTGVPFKTSVKLYPTVKCIISLNEIPFLVINISDIEIIYFERVSQSLKNFDMAIIFKDFSRPIKRITTIPMENLDMLKTWADENDILYGEGLYNMNWGSIMNNIKEAPDQFIEDGCWNFLAENASDDENEDDDVGDDDPEYEEEEVESSESEYEDEEEQSESEGEDEGDDALSEKGKEWEEMEEDAKKSDNERAKRMKENERFKKNKNNNVRNKKK